MTQEIPVYLFTGFLDAGKTKFIQETLEDVRFNNGESTLLLLCEEGEEEYDPSTFSGKNVFIETIEEQEELTPSNLERLQKKHAVERVVIEYNGMWMLDTLYQNMPDSWIVYQEFMFADSQTFLTYNANMRGLVVDKLKSCEMLVLNRADEKHAGAIKSILCSSKYKNLSALAKRMVCEKYFGDLLGRVASVLPYIERNNATEAAKALYEKRKEAACHGDA